MDETHHAGVSFSRLFLSLYPSPVGRSLPFHGGRTTTCRPTPWLCTGLRPWCRILAPTVMQSSVTIHTLPGSGKLPVWCCHGTRRPVHSEPASVSLV